MISSTYKCEQQRSLEDGVELSRSFHRHVVAPDSDSSNESADVKAMVAQFHTDSVKAAYKTHKKSDLVYP